MYNNTEVQFTEYLNFFGVTKENLQHILNIALSTGGEYADIFFEHSLANELSLSDGEVNAAGSHIDYGVGIRVISGEKTGYAYSEITTLPLMEKAAKTAAQIALQGGKVSIPHNISILENKNYYTIKIGWDNYSVSNKIP